MKLTDVRVEQATLRANDFAVTWALIHDRRVFNVDWEPPASGPEAQVTFRDLTEGEVRAICAEHALAILTLREREVSS